MALVIKPDGDIVVLKPANGKKFTYDELSKAVGGMIEHIPYKWDKAAVAELPKDARGKTVCTAWCNEMGKLTPPVYANPRATRLFVCQPDYMVGDILLCYAGES